MGESYIHQVLKSGINRFLDDTREKILTRKVVRVYGKDDWNEITAALQEWEENGFLKILSDPVTANDSEPCIEMLKYIDRASPFLDWP